MKTVFSSPAKLLPVLMATALMFLASCKTHEKLPQHSSQSVYLFTSFHDADQKFLRFLWSKDGYHWTNVPGTFLEANVGEAKQFRDPSIAQGPDGMYHLVWTTGWHDSMGFGYAESSNLIDWSEQKFIPVMANEPTTVNVWAPEIFYDESDDDFIIVWASTIPGRFPDMMESHTNNQRLYFTTTHDFQSFSPTQLFFDAGFSVIDGFILRDANRYVLICKDNSRPNLRLGVAFGDTALGPWKDIYGPITPRFTEGPCALHIGDDWLIYFDAYRDKRYGAVKTQDFKTFTDISSEVTFPEGHKHGTAFKVPQDVLDDMLKAHPYPNL
ncbi:MAG TPA: glycoside hydrolase family 43 protein [Verrucomicrobiae bacterium]|nr:glycoside hydrolase family 43 protein [Verrucomicrobiae bacterium]